MMMVDCALEAPKVDGESRFGVRLPVIDKRSIAQWQSETA